MSNELLTSLKDQTNFVEVYKKKFNYDHLLAMFKGGGNKEIYNLFNDMINKVDLINFLPSEEFIDSILLFFKEIGIKSIEEIESCNGFFTNILKSRELSKNFILSISSSCSMGIITPTKNHEKIAKRSVQDFDNYDDFEMEIPEAIIMAINDKDSSLKNIIGNIFTRINKFKIVMLILPQDFEYVYECKKYLLPNFQLLTYRTKTLTYLHDLSKITGHNDGLLMHIISNNDEIKNKSHLFSEGIIDDNNILPNNILYERLKIIYKNCSYNLTEDYYVNYVKDNFTFDSKNNYSSSAYILICGLNRGSIKIPDVIYTIKEFMKWCGYCNICRKTLIFSNRTDFIKFLAIVNESNKRFYPTWIKSDAQKIFYSYFESLENREGLRNIKKFNLEVNKLKIN